MKELKYELILEKKVKRRIIILSSLLEVNRPIPLKELATQCDSSNVTLNKDIEELLTLFPGYLKVNMTSITPKLESIEKINIIRAFIDDSIKSNPLFYIIENIFYGNYQTVEVLADFLYIGVTTLRKHLAQLKKVLAKYNLSLRQNPIEIIGAEADIRFFYFQYFTHSNSTAYFKTNQQTNAKLYNTLQYVASNHGFSLNLDLHRFSQWLAIIEQRVQLNKYIHLNSNIVEKYSHFTSFFILSDAIKTNFSTAKLEQLNSSELVYLFLTSFDSIVYDDNSCFFLDEFSTNMNQFDPLINAFFTENQLNFALNTNLSTALKAYLANTLALSEITVLFQRNTENIKKRVERRYSKTLNSWYKILINESHFQYTYDLAVNLTLLTEAKKNSNKKVLFMVTGSPTEANYYKSIIINLFPKNLNFMFNYNQQLDDSLIEKLGVTLCVCNSTPIQKITKCEVFQFSYSPLDSEWLILIKRLEDY